VEVTSVRLLATLVIAEHEVVNHKCQYFKLTLAGGMKSQMRYHEGKAELRKSTTQLRLQLRGPNLQYTGVPRDPDGTDRLAAAPPAQPAGWVPAR
jgi:hypothetical protein